MAAFLVFSSHGHVSGVIVIDEEHPTMYDIEPALDAHFTNVWFGHHGIRLNRALCQFTVTLGGKGPRYDSDFTYQIMHADAVSTWKRK